MNCCQAVLTAFADELGRSDEELLRIGSGFGSGMGTMEGTCGALVGATICRDLKGVATGKVLCSCENCVRNAVQAASEALKI